MEFGNGENLSVFYICSNLISRVLGQVAVPLFFFISGFLFFRNIDGFTKRDYLKKLRNRGKTLLVPYLFWNITTLLLLCIAQSVPAIDLWINNNVAYNFRYILESMWGMWNKNGTMACPIADQFWFIRDLMVAVILTPVIYLYIKRAKVYGVLLLGILWFFNWWFDFVGGRGLSIVAVFFFTAGAWFGSNKRNLIDDMSKVKYWSFVLYPLLVIADLLTKKYAGNIFIHHAGIIAGIVFWFNLVAYLLKAGKIGVSRFLTASSFFVFAIHDPFVLPPIRKVLYAVLNPQSDLVITTLYFFVVLITVLIALGLYYLLKRFLPKFTAIITGGR
jgi:surface polysaccharide O-acyltransferase-like enzyme